MRKLFIAIALLLGMCSAGAQESYTREGNTYTAVITNRGRDARANAEQTACTWQDTKGRTYPIWIARTGSCFVIRVSKKTGSEYRQYLGPELSRDICKRMGRTYTPRTRKEEKK